MINAISVNLLNLYRSATAGCQEALARRTSSAARFVLNHWVASSLAAAALLIGLLSCRHFFHHRFPPSNPPSPPPPTRAAETPPPGPPQPAASSVPLPVGSGSPPHVEPALPSVPPAPPEPARAVETPPPGPPQPSSAPQQSAASSVPLPVGSGSSPHVEPASVPLTPPQPARAAETLPPGPPQPAASSVALPVGSGSSPHVEPASVPLTSLQPALPQGESSVPPPLGPQSSGSATGPVSLRPEAQLSQDQMLRVMVVCCCFYLVFQQQSSGPRLSAPPLASASRASEDGGAAAAGAHSQASGGPEAVPPPSLAAASTTVAPVAPHPLSPEQRDLVTFLEPALATQFAEAFVRALPPGTEIQRNGLAWRIVFSESREVVLPELFGIHLHTADGNSCKLAMSGNTVSFEPPIFYVTHPLAGFREIIDHRLPDGSLKSILQGLAKSSSWVVGDPVHLDLTGFSMREDRISPVVRARSVSRLAPHIWISSLVDLSRSFAVFSKLLEQIRWT